MNMNNEKLKDFLSFFPRDPNMMDLKRKLYIILFACLGLMVAYFLYVLSTVATIFLLLLNFAQYSLGLSWGVWSVVSKIWLGVILLSGWLIGMSLGKHFWRVIYIEKRLTETKAKKS